MSRVDLFNVVKSVNLVSILFLAVRCADLYECRIKRLQDFPSVMAAVGTKSDSLGCETCKPAVGSILSSLYNEHVMKPVHHQNQDTNDKSVYIPSLFRPLLTIGKRFLTIRSNRSDI